MPPSTFYSPKELAKRATRRYLFALFVIALLSLSAFWVMTQKLEKQEDYAHIINLSGQQRMLSQKGYLCASRWLTYDSLSKASKGRIKQNYMALDKVERRCLSTISQFKNNHQTLVEYVASEEHGKQLSDEIKTMYLNYSMLSRDVEIYTSQLMQAMKKRDAVFLPGDVHRLGLLNRLDKAVGLFKNDSDIYLQNLKQTEFIILLTILLALALEALFIFSPVVQALKHEQERLIIAQRKAEKSSRQKAEFLANMSHEIRTPINGMSGMIQLLKMTNLTAEQQEFVHTLGKSTNNLLLLVNDILDFSKLEANKMRMEQQPFSIYELVDDLVELVFQDAQQRGFDFRVRVSPDVPEWLIGDIMRLRQILLNFVSNAFKFTEVGYVQLDVSVISAPDGNVVLRFLVEDTGKGIAPDRLETIFQKFEQESDSTTKHYGGTGLGLSICKQLIDQMSGKMGVKSLPGEGASFWFDIPLMVKKDFTDENDMIEKGLKPLRVLIVDKEPFVQKYLSELLTSWGMTVFVCSDSNEGVLELERAHQEVKPYNLVLCSENLSGQSGKSFGRSVKSHPLLHLTQVVLMAHRYKPKMHEDVRLLAFSGVLVKPLSPLLLRQLFLALSSQDKDNDPSPSDCFYTRRSLRQIYDEWHQYSSSPLEKGVLDLKTDKVYKKMTVLKKPGKVLVVDDTPINLKVMEHMLSKLGFSIDVAVSGREALQKVKENNYQLLVMDYHMPEMNGVEATEVIRLTHDAESLPIIALTADVTEEVKQVCYKAGMNAFLEKPIGMDALRDCLSLCRIELDEGVDVSDTVASEK